MVGAHKAPLLPAAGAPLAVTLMLFLATPAAIMIAVSFLESSFAGIEWHFTLANYQRLIVDGTALRVLAKSAATGVVVTCIVIVLAYPTAYWIVRRPASHRALWLLLLLVPYWISYVIRTYAWYPLLGTTGVLNSLLLAAGILDTPSPLLLFSNFSVLLGLVYVYFPFAAIPIYLALDRIDRSLLEASADLGARSSQTFWRVIFPLSLPGTVAGGLLVFILAAGSYVTPKLLGGPSSIMFGELIADQFGGTFNWAFGATLALAFLAIVSLVLASAGRAFGIKKVFFHGDAA